MHPVLTVNGTAALLGTNSRSAARAIRRLCDATIVAQADTSQRNRIYAATDIIDLYAEFAAINPSGWRTPRKPRRYWPDPNDTPPPR